MTTKEAFQIRARNIGGFFTPVQTGLAKLNGEILASGMRSEKVEKAQAALAEAQRLLIEATVC